MDLKVWDHNNNIYILYLVDMFTRYTVAVVIKRKLPETIIEAVMRTWVQYFGIMGEIITDNGGEFSNEQMRELTSILNVTNNTTGAESPWQNGLCE
jgi:IS30 family transposase